MATDLTGATVELLQTLIRNQCVNDGTAGVGSRDAQRRRAAVVRRGARRDDRTMGADAGPGVVRRPPRGARPERAEPVPDGPHRRRARCTPHGLDARPVRRRAGHRRRRRRRGVGPRRRRHAQPHRLDGRGVQATSPTAASGRAATCCTSPSPTRRPAAPTAPAGSPTTTRTRSAATTCSPRAAACTTARPEAPAIGVTVGEKGVAWRRLRVRGTPGHGSMPFRIDNALVKAAAVVQRLAEYRPAPRFHELWPARVESLNVPRRAEAGAARPAAHRRRARRRCPAPPPPPTSTPARTRRSRRTSSTAG